MKRYTIGIDLGGTIIKIGIVQDEQMIASATLESDSGNGLGRKLPEIDNCIKRMLQDQQITNSSVA